MKSTWKFGHTVTTPSSEEKKIERYLNNWNEPPPSFLQYKTNQKSFFALKGIKTEKKQTSNLGTCPKALINNMKNSQAKPSCHFL